MDSRLGFLEDISPEEIQSLSPLVKAHIGDAYFHLFVRTRLLKVTHRITRLHDLSAEIVSAVSQAQVYGELEEELSAEERDIFRRGRNAKTHSPKRSTVAQYHASTGFETLLGELFLRGKFERLEQICAAALGTESVTRIIDKWKIS